ncbi:hypothetical protein BK128_09725 [Viridibacillus sp. FSL H7-0596]|uniref:phage tail family protein n=1 Tax=Viridibacillus sp. FSL H7-0596 TaxID=1928923 RepID=UPI00096D30AC|nr:phage tail family protein [Viridibacillus sp. FSL H7-0596]OMC86933.1 hypothetical protein BK128_09725 [Viridibacillus sp. FSL H7-0596]
METITFTNSRGETVKFGGPPFYLQSVTGLGDVTAQIQSQKSPFQDGSAFLDAVLDDRDIDIIFVIVADLEQNYGDVSKARSQIARVCNPTLGPGILRYENDYVVRIIEAVASHVPIYGDNGERTKTLQKGMLNFVCNNPFWLDSTTENIKLEDFVAHFRFPFKFPVRFASRGDSRVLMNNGDVPTPIRVEFRGEAVNPKITNVTTGKFIKINRSIPDDYKLVIDTSFGVKRKVEIIAPDGIAENAMHYMDLDSDFFSLDVGENKFSFITDSGRPEVYVEYKNRYLSV